MAEIRKFNPEAGNAIAQALSAAMGETVRPRVPGRPTAKPQPAEPENAPAPSVFTVRLTTQSAPGGEPEDD